MSSDAEELAPYLKSMPLDYRATFDRDAVRAHEAIVGRRADRAVHIEIWRQLSDRVVAVCVVADDKPGLLSCVSGALLAHQIDVVSAHAYCRTREDGAVEAIDLLWIRRLPGPKNLVSPIRARHLAALASAIERAAAGRVEAEIVIEPPPASSSELLRLATGTGEMPIAVDPADAGSRPSGVTASARIRFDTNDDGATVLTVEAVDRFTLVQADGKRLEQSHLLGLQPALLAAVDEGAFAPQRRSTA